MFATIPVPLDPLVWRDGQDLERSHAAETGEGDAQLAVVGFLNNGDDFRVLIQRLYKRRLAKWSKAAGEGFLRFRRQGLIPEIDHLIFVKRLLDCLEHAVVEILGQVNPFDFSADRTGKGFDI